MTVTHHPFKCPQCKRIHHNGPVDPEMPEIYECENCGRFRLRTDVRADMPASPEQLKQEALKPLELDEVDEAIRLLAGTDTLGVFGKVLIETLKNYQAILAQKKESADLIANKSAAVIKFLQDHALLTFSGAEVQAVHTVAVPAAAGGEQSGIGTSPSDPDHVFTIDVSARQLADRLIEPLLLEANLAGRHSGRKAVLRAFGVTFDDRSKFHAQQALIAKSPDHYVHQGAMAAFETASKMVIHQAEEGPDDRKPAHLDS